MKDIIIEEEFHQELLKNIKTSLIHTGIEILEYYKKDGLEFLKLLFPFTTTGNILTYQYNKKTNELLAYMTLSADSIKLKAEEKEFHDIAKVPYAAMPALKVGKLAVNREVSKEAKRKGYGSFMLEMARAFAFDMNETGIACRFITVDADIEYNPDTPDFYIKNGFVENLSLRSRNPKHTISMRKDIFVDEDE